MFAITLTLCLVSFGIGAGIGIIAAVYFMMQSKEMIQRSFKSVGLNNRTAANARFTESLS